MLGGECVEACHGENLGTTDAPNSALCPAGNPPICCAIDTPSEQILVSMCAIFLGIIVLTMLLSACRVDRWLGVQVVEAEAVSQAVLATPSIPNEADVGTATTHEPPADEECRRLVVASRLNKNKKFYGIRHSALPKLLQFNFFIDHFLPFIGYRPAFIADVRAAVGDFIFYYQNNAAVGAMFLCPEVNIVNRSQHRLLFYCIEGIGFMSFVFLYLLTSTFPPTENLELFINLAPIVVVIPVKVIIHKLMKSLLRHRWGQVMVVSGLGLRLGTIVAAIFCVTLGTVCFYIASMFLSMLNRSSWVNHPGELVYIYAFKILVTSSATELGFIVLKFWPVPLPKGRLGWVLGKAGLGSRILEMHMDGHAMASAELRQWSATINSSTKVVEKVTVGVSGVIAVGIEMVADNPLHLSQTEM